MSYPKLSDAELADLRDVATEVIDGPYGRFPAVRDLCYGVFELLDTVDDLRATLFSLRATNKELLKKIDQKAK